MLTVYYDLSKNPPTYDFVTFLLWAECMRLDRKEDGVEIVILPGPKDGFRIDNLWPPKAETRRDLLNKIVLPMATLLPSCMGISSWSARPQKKPNSIGYGEYTIQFSMRYLEAMRRGLRPLRAPGQIIRDERLITITLREAEHWPLRNSNLPEWLSAAHHLSALGYEVIFVRDTLRADECLPGGYAGSQDGFASRDMHARARLYASAALNLFVSNGPAWLALAMDVPAIIFRPASGMPNGLRHGEQMPRSPAYQQLVWADDTCDNIVNACQVFFGQREQVVA